MNVVTIKILKIFLICFKFEPIKPVYPTKALIFFHEK